MTATMNEASNRAAKADRLISTIDRVTADAGITDTKSLVANLERMSPKWWADIADLTGDNPPSDDTKAVAISVLRRRIEPAVDIVAAVGAAMKRLNGVMPSL